ncbi:hypothetical protein ABID21_003652 [Pseudorhizobium tarimense]|uniref:Uncharacterized protein n=1 Tax=Pseudorhizobium tarimense TaxID=1079109 RepID=A0ABV2HBE8_9HYPH|nr:hypothetical protein [Pseudorhizobium tarimense]MCJ8520481.1 hypothetical protein [Pseudorhizobium tarimense]
MVGVIHRTEAQIELRTAGNEVMPAGRGNTNLNEIPFVMMGARDLSLAPELPPLLGVARSAIALYQLSADYRWQLFMTGQETLVVINAMLLQPSAPVLSLPSSKATMRARLT